MSQEQRRVLSLTNISKSFGGVAALDGVSMDLAAGQIHALLGANGSGKSTLVKIMTGVYQSDSGSLAFDDKKMKSFTTPVSASRFGIRVVHQEAPLIDTLSVTEAVAIFRGYGTASFGSIKWNALNSKVQNLLDKMDVPIRAEDQCNKIGPADRAGLALAIVAGDIFDQDESNEPVRLLIVDEVTASIQVSETHRHLERLRIIADKGVSVLMVTHRLRELEIADEISILRGGKLVYEEKGKARLSNHELVEEMLGSKAISKSNFSSAGNSEKKMNTYDAKIDFSAIWGEAPKIALPLLPTSRSKATPAISAVNLSGENLKNCNFEGQAGEILGFTGLRGSGVEELPGLLSGDKRWHGGKIRIGNSEIQQGERPSEVIEAGLVAIPADRLRAGGIASFDVRENIALPNFKKYWHQAKRWNSAVSSVMDSFDLQPPLPRKLFGSFSGGNQQKILIGKWLLLKPKVFVLDDPTYGVDPAARETIFSAMKDAAERGVSILFFSTEPEQLVRLCDRILVIRDGAIVKELVGSEKNLETVTEWSYQ